MFYRIAGFSLCFFFTRKILPIFVNASVEKNSNPGLNKNSDRNIVSYFVLDNNHYQYRNNIEECNDNRSESKCK